LAISLNSGDEISEPFGNEIVAPIHVAQLDALIVMLTSARDQARAEGAIL
jgi:hypothetical protein